LVILFLSPPSDTGDHSRYWLFCFYLLLQSQVTIADVGYGHLCLKEEIETE
jgi:hypothetical protein